MGRIFTWKVLFHTILFICLEAKNNLKSLGKLGKELATLIMYSYFTLILFIGFTFYG
jgi:hypothetical protein